MITNKLRIGVFMGGKSIEREVSFNSGRTICDHLDTQRYTIIPVFQSESGKLYFLPQHFLHRGKIADFFGRLDTEAQSVTWDCLKKHVDFIYLAVHGRYAEDGTIQGMLEIMNIPYLGTKVLGSALGMNKSMQKTFLRTHGIDVPRGLTLTSQEIESLNIHEILSTLTQIGITLPFIVKPTEEGSSLGISLVQSVDELIPALNKACTIDPRRLQDVMIEEQLRGKEFVCVSLEKISYHHKHLSKTWFSLPLTEVVIEDNTHFFDYEQKYMPGRALKITPARCSEEDRQRIVATCEHAAQLLQFSTIARIDGFLTDDNRVVIIDPNSLTGMSPATFLFNQAAEYGMSHTELINFLIENELKHYGMIDDQSYGYHEKDAPMTQSNQSKIRVAVLLGGDSNEREISLESGRNICYKLSPYKYEVLPIFVNEHMELFKLSPKLLIKNTTRAIAQLVTPEMQLQWSDLPSMCDFVFIGLHGGKGENGAVQGALEMLDMPYNGPGVLASALCMDKAKTNNFLHSKGFHVPTHTLLSREEWNDFNQLEKEHALEQYLSKHQLTFPLIVKPHDDGCSVMVNKVLTIKEFASTLDSFFSSNKQAALIEEYIVGVELTIGVIGNDNIIALPPSMTVAKKDFLSLEEKFLPGAGENQTPAPLPVAALDLVKQTIINVFKTIGGKGYSRIDCFYQPAAQSPTSQDRVVILEINTLPALTPATCLFHQAAELGIKPMDFIDKLIELGFEAFHINHLDKSLPTQQSFFTQETPISESSGPLAKEPIVQMQQEVESEPQVMRLF